MRVTPELTEIPADGAPTSRWQQAFDAPMTDVFRVQSDIASNVARSLGVALDPGEEKHFSERPTGAGGSSDAGSVQR